MTLGIRFCASRKGGKEKVAGFQCYAEITWLLLGRRVLVALGEPFLLFCMNGFIKQTSVPVVAPFLTLEHFPSMQSLAESCDSFKDWVCFESEQWLSQDTEVARTQEVHAAKGSTLRCLVLISPREARK